ncbi:hypothetical protein B0H19DRAFT_1080152 [Mycena capillaripes]|nr:hypothetical protein B0H19DRAFT_1080152 [Mycena capillaripes]
MPVTRSTTRGRVTHSAACKNPALLKQVFHPKPAKKSKRDLKDWYMLGWGLLSRDRDHIEDVNEMETDTIYYANKFETLTRYCGPEICTIEDDRFWLKQLSKVVEATWKAKGDFWGSVFVTTRRNAQMDAPTKIDYICFQLLLLPNFRMGYKFFFKKELAQSNGMSSVGAPMNAYGLFVGAPKAGAGVPKAIVGVPMNTCGRAHEHLWARP